MKRTGQQMLGWSKSAMLSGAAASMALSIPPQVASAQAVTPTPSTIAGSVCGVERGSTSAFGNSGIRWVHNDNGGTSPDASVDNGTLFASASPAVPTNITAQINVFDYNLDTRTIPSAQTATDYFEYRFTTADFPELGELNGVSFAGYAATNAGDNQASGAYQISVQVAEGPVFTDAQTLVSNIQVDDISFPGADDVSDPQRFSPTTQVAGHYDANGTAIALKPETDYIMRVFFFNASRSGQDAGTPFPNNIIIWDDFFLKGTNCESPTAVDDGLTDLAPDTVATFDASEMSGILGNDTASGDAEIDQATVILIPPAGETVTNTITDDDGDVVGFTVADQGTWAYDDTSGDLTFTPVAGFLGDPASITYTVDDSIGLTSDPATVSVDYVEVPIANDDSESSDIVTAVMVDPLENDRDEDGTLDETSVVLTGANAPDGSILAADGLTLTVPDEGVWTVSDTTGEITFTPEDTFAGTTTPAAYTVDDNDGNTSNVATVTVSFGEPPVATNDSVTPTEPGPVTIDPLGNDRGDDNLDPTSVVLTGTDAPAGSVLSANGKSLSVPNEGDWTVNETTGLVTFTPAATFSGTPTPAAYTVSDVLGRASNEATLSVTVLPPAEIVAANDGPITMDGTNGGTSTVSVFDNDTLDGSTVTDPSQVTLALTSVPADLDGSLVMNADGTLTLAADTPAGTYTIGYEICETANASNCATAQIELVVVDGGTELIIEIEEDLVAILSEDLANTLTTQSNQISGYSASALDRLRGRHGADSCLIDINARLAVQNIVFATDRAVILPQSDATLDAIAAILIDCGQNAFEIAGHTDSDASDAYNLDLSQRRAEAVRRALAERGVDTSGFVAQGYGESQPIATNATAAGKAQNRRVEFLPLERANAYQGPCDDGFSLVRSLTATANDDGITADGQFVSDQHDCITDRRQVFEGTLSYLDTDQGQTQSAINLSYRSEQYRGSESVFGYFVGVYGSQSDVTRLATGEINGVGLNGGIYGANALHDALFVDYYLGAAAGRHTFDLDFDRDLGSISATGDYQYFAGFAGAALSGEVALGDTTLTPRVGFDYVYTPGADVDVVAELGSLSDAGNLDLDAISGGRLFAEVRADQLLQNGASNVWFNPRVACYQSIGSLDGVCGFGGSIGIESTSDDSDLTYALELDGEWGEGYTQGSLSVRASRQMDVGTISADAGVTRNGSGTLGGIYEIKF